MNPSQKISQYLTEARASEDALIRVLQSQIAMTPAGSYRSGLEAHLEETRDHSRRLRRRIGELGVRRDPVRLAIDLTEEMLGQTWALAKAPLDLARGSSGEETVLKNARDAAAAEALEIATYTAIEQLARSVGDDATARLAREILTDEERMLARILDEIPALTDAVARAHFKGDRTYDVTRTGAADALRNAGAAARRTARQARRAPGVAQAEGELKGAIADEADLAIAGYGELTAEEITTRLPGLSQVELAKVDAFERRHDNRSTVLDRIETLRGEEPWPGYDELTVAEIETSLAGRDDDELRRIRAYERAHKDRAGVMRATERQLERA